MALGKRRMSTQGMIPQVCGVWSWEVRLATWEDSDKIEVNPSVLKKKASIKQIGINQWRDSKSVQHKQNTCTSYAFTNVILLDNLLS